MPRVRRLEGFEVWHRSSEELEGLRDEIFVQEAYAFDAVRDDPVIIDCGGNIGMATLYFKKRYPKARITVLEPNPACAELLRRNIRVNHLRDVEVIEAAAWSRAGSKLMYPEITEDPEFTLGTTLIENLWGDDATGPGFPIRTIRLSSILRGAVDFMKMDIEGAEETVLRELGESLSSIRELIIEYHGTAIGEPLNSLARIVGLLERHGFAVRVQTDLEDAEPGGQPGPDGRAQYGFVRATGRGAEPTVRPGTA